MKIVYFCIFHRKINTNTVYVYKKSNITCLLFVCVVCKIFTHVHCFGGGLYEVAGLNTRGALPAAGECGGGGRVVLLVALVGVQGMRCLEEGHHYA